MEPLLEAALPTGHGRVLEGPSEGSEDSEQVWRTHALGPM